MDDVDAELDGKRISHLLEYLEGRTQTFVTTSKEELVKQFAARASVHEVLDGAVAASELPERAISTVSTAAECI
jgi:recombinational DNA repair ATPase RecF